MKKLALLLGVLFFVINYASAYSAGCCCVYIDGTLKDNYATYTAEQCEIGNQGNQWTPYSEEFPDELVDPSLDPDFASWCSSLCPATSDNDTITPGTHTVTGIVYNGTVSATTVLDGATVVLHVLNSFDNTITNSEGRFTFTNMPEQNSLDVIASFLGCSQETISTQVPTIGDLEIVLDCSAPICTIDPVDTIGAERTDGFEIEIIPEDISPINPDCRDLVDYVYVSLCVGFGENKQCRYVSYSNNKNDLFDGEHSYINLSQHNLGFGQGGWLDNVSANNEVQFAIGIKYDNFWIWGNPFSRSLGDPACWKNIGEFCDGEDIKVCDYTTMESETTVDCVRDVGPNYYCYYEDAGDAECAYQEDCGVCNSVNYMFPDLFSIIGNDNVEIDCPELVDSVGLSSCYYASSRTAQDYYADCSEVESCYDYTSKNSCIDEPCRVTGNKNCDWKEVYPKVLGKGLCYPEDEGLDCTECKADSGCTEQICEGLGCSYGIRTGEQWCLPLSRFGCVDYTNQLDCTGSSNVPVLLDVEDLDNDGDRDGGTNRKLNLSQDKYGKGVCYWDPIELECVKDSDGDREKDACQGNYLNVPCEADNKPPETFLPLEGGSNVDLNDLVGMGDDIVLVDNLYTDDWITTRFCLSLQGTSPCYPTQQLEVIRNDPPLEEGWYLLRYYSEDGSNNLEVVKEMELLIANVSIPGVKGVKITP